MCTRCVACNAKLSTFEFASRKPDNPEEFEDLCSTCRNEVYSWDDEFEHEYQHEQLTEGLLSFLNTE